MLLSNHKSVLLTISHTHWLLYVYAYLNISFSWFEKKVKFHLYRSLQKMQAVELHLMMLNSFQKVANPKNSFYPVMLML